MKKQTRLKTGKKQNFTDPQTSLTNEEIEEGFQMLKDLENQAVKKISSTPLPPPQQQQQPTSAGAINVSSKFSSSLRGFLKKIKSESRKGVMGGDYCYGKLFYPSTSSAIFVNSTELHHLYNTEPTTTNAMTTSLHLSQMSQNQPVYFELLPEGHLHHSTNHQLKVL